MGDISFFKKPTMRKSKVSVRFPYNFSKQSTCLIPILINNTSLRKIGHGITLLHLRAQREDGQKLQSKEPPQKGIRIVNCRLKSLQLKHEFLRRCRRLLDT